MPGFRERHVYPMTPDVAKARELVRRAHASGRTAVLYTCDAYPCSEQAQIVKTDLAAIGLRNRDQDPSNGDVVRPRGAPR